MILASVRASALGIAAACVAVALFGVLSGFALTDARLVEVIRNAFANGELAYADRTHEDFFSECALLEMQQLRRRDSLLSAFDTKLLDGPGDHPCDWLRAVTLGSAEQKAALPAAASYINYPFGSRHLEAFVLSVIDYGPATQLYRALSYGSVAVLFLAMLWRAPATASVLGPIPLLLIGGFALHRFGGNLAHAPGYFCGFLAFAVFVGMPRWFHGAARRLAFAGVLGVLAAYFDLLNGVIVTLLALTILLNHFFYLGGERDQPDYILKAASQACAIFGCFLAAYIAVTLGRLGLLWLNGVDISVFMARLLARTQSDIGIRLTFGLNLETLFAARFQLTPGGADPASWVFVAGIAGWMFVALIGLATLALRRRLQTPALVDVLVLAAVSLGVLAWYRTFTAHTYVHALFMVRLLAIPLSCGIVAALLAIREARADALPLGVLPAALCVALPLAALVLHKRWTIGTAVEAHFVDTRADLVSCGRLGLRPDGEPDGIIAIRFRRTPPPLAYLGFRSSGETHVQLVRRDPLGVYHTGHMYGILGMADEPGGPLLNRPDGGFAFAGSGERILYAHFCRDGPDRPGSTYELRTDGVRVPISP